jgi:hypothetical protein
MRPVALAVLMLVVLLPSPSLAGAPIELVNPGDRPIRVVGRLGAGQPFVGETRVVARGGNAPRFRFLPTGLRGPEGRAAPGRIRLVGPRNLRRGGNTLRVRVSGVRAPGTYKRARVPSRLGATAGK